MQILRSCRCNLRSPSRDRRSDHGPCWWFVAHHCNPSQPAQKIWLSVDPRPDLRSVSQVTDRSSCPWIDAQKPSFSPELRLTSMDRHSIHGP
ncbi:hypothetical protein MTR67_053011 [Solanum verrucosum]|uniref:Late blight resistance protein n=1 Tax=Solanum verrucosum TaxID=315347 RepID=A0AAF1A1K0_SOLVR|nr:hypothetical protein MTR67_053011 [Solanum verrucosum]